MSGKRQTNRFTPLFRQIVNPYDPGGAQNGKMVPGAADQYGNVWSHFVVYNIEDLILPGTQQYSIGGFLPGDALVIPNTAPESIEALLGSAAVGYGYTGVGFTRNYSYGNNSDNITARADGFPASSSFLMAFDDANWDRVRCGDTSSDASQPHGQGVLHVGSFNYGFNGNTFDRLRSGANNADGVAALSLGVLQIGAYEYIWNGATWDRQKSKSGSADVNLSGGSIDRSGTIAVGGTSQQLMAANTARKFFVVQNLSTTLNLGIRLGAGAAAIGTANTFTIPPLESIAFPETSAVQIVGPNAGQAFTSFEV